MVMAGYATIRNPCAHAIAMTDVSGDDFTTAMIHETRVQNGMSQMRHVGALMIPAKGQTRLTPGGAHLMLMQPKRQFREGDKTRLSLKLADGRVVSANFYVRLDPRGK